MSFKEFISPLTFWYYDKDMSLTDRALSCFWMILLLPIAPVILAAEHEHSAEYRDLSSGIQDLRDCYVAYHSYRYLTSGDPVGSF